MCPAGHTHLEVEVLYKYDAGKRQPESKGVRRKAEFEGNAHKRRVPPASTYDGLNRRVKKDLDTAAYVLYIHDAWQVIEERELDTNGAGEEDDAWEPRRQYVYGVSCLLLSEVDLARRREFKEMLATCSAEDSFRAARFMAILTVAVLLPGCGRKLPVDLQAELNARPGLKERAVTLKPAAIPAASYIGIADFLVGVPEGWKIQQEKAERTPSQVNATYGRLKLTRVDSGKEFAIEFRYGQMESWVSPPNPDTIDTIKARVEDPVAFLERYETDLDLFQAIYNATPARIKLALSEETANHYVALMHLKGSLPLPGKRIDGKLLTAYGSTHRRHLMFAAYLFDPEGMLRGIGVLVFPQSMSTEEVETTVGQLLYNSRFTDTEEPEEN